jgi:hypothetical protein
MAMRNRLLLAASLLAASLLSVACPSISGPSTLKTYTGQYSVQVVESTVTVSLQGGGTFPCTNTYTMSGTVTLKVDQATGGESSAIVDGTQTETAHSTGDSCKAKGNLSTKWSPKLSVSGNDLSFDDQHVATNGGYGVTSRVTFAGTLSNGVVTGALGLSVSGSGVIGGTASVSQNYSTTVNVTLR